MNLTVFSHKPCWRSPASPSGYATDGGFALQMRALSELFEKTTVVVPCSLPGPRAGETPITGCNLSVEPLTRPRGHGLSRKIAFPFWILRNAGTLIRQVHQADGIHTPIPGDIGTVGMLMAWLLHKPLFVRHCGNWSLRRTFAEHFWRWFIERFAGGKNVMLVTGGAPLPPSPRNHNVHWVFSTSLTERQLADYGRVRDRALRGGPQLIITCRQEREKGTGVVIESLPLILSKYPGARLHVVGDGGALTGFRELAAQIGVQDRVVFHGQVEHDGVLRLLRASDLFCDPTMSSEGFPKVVLEALASGLPVITTRVSVLPELLANGCGILIDDANPRSVAAAVTACLDDAAAYTRMSANAVRVASQYSLERWRDVIGDFIRAAWGPLGVEDKVRACAKTSLGH